MTKPLEHISIARVSTVPFYVVTQLREQIETIKNAGAVVSIITSDEVDNKLKLAASYEYLPVYIARKINIVTDVVALFQLWKLFRTHQFDIVHSTTPKAGLLCAIAAKMAAIPIRLHTFTGQAWVTLGGLKRIIVKWCDTLIAKLNTRCYADSLSQRDYLIHNKVAAQDKLFVLGKGSLAGVNTQRFSKSRFTEQEQLATKESLGITNDPLIIIFVGRITKDKGIYELIDAFEHIIKKEEPVVLLLVGPMELDLGKEWQDAVKKRCSDKIIFTGYTAEPERFMAIADILCIPSYREGFGTVVIEAAAMGLPVVGTKIYGLADAIIDGVTGILVEPKHSAPLQDALEQLLYDDSLRMHMGEAAKKRAISDFASTHCNELLVKEYEALLQQVKADKWSR